MYSGSISLSLSWASPANMVLVCLVQSLVCSTCELSSPQTNRNPNDKSATRQLWSCERKSTAHNCSQICSQICTSLVSKLRNSKMRKVCRNTCIRNYWYSGSISLSVSWAVQADIILGCFVSNAGLLHSCTFFSPDKQKSERQSSSKATLVLQA